MSSAKGKVKAAPEEPLVAAKKTFSAAQKRYKKILLQLVPALKTAPIYIVSTHGAYDLRKTPVLWTVPKNTFIFETQTIGDTTLTKIDNVLWKLCLTKYRAAFFHYFMGNRWFFQKKGEEPLPVYMEMFRNLILYKPGDMIYERQLSIGGGHGREADGSARQSYVNMGFYKFSVDPSTPAQAPPKRTTKRPMLPTEMGELDSLRTTLIEDDDFHITTKQFVELVNDEEPIEYDGVEGLADENTFTLENDGETVRIFIFSSCAAVNCNPKPPREPWPPVDLPAAEANALKAAHKAAIKKAYKSKACNANLEMIERQQRAISLELAEMGIGTGPGGSGWDLDLDPIKALGLSTVDLRQKVKGKGPQAFLPEEHGERFAELDDDLAEWWKLVDEADGPPDLNADAPRNVFEGGRRTLRNRRVLGKKRSTVKYRS
jgi:hypothetical protein